MRWRVPCMGVFYEWINGIGVVMCDDDFRSTA